MRRSGSLVALALALVLPACGDPAAPAAPAPSPPPVAADPRTLALKVGNMDCSGCAATVRKLIEALDGVESVQADSKTGAVAVRLAEGADPEAVRAAIPAALENPGGKRFELEP